jgi:hypothetical protein
MFLLLISCLAKHSSSSALQVFYVNFKGKLISPHGRKAVPWPARSSLSRVIEPKVGSQKTKT